MSEKNSGNSRTVLGTVVAAVVTLVAGYFGVDAVTGDNGSSAAPSTTPPVSGISAAADEDTCPVDTLPEQADDVIDAILDGGPFDHGTADGKHFGNYQGILPRESSSFYREYTVSTPGVNHRGARRIVVGGGSATDPDTWYYTDDHFESFCEIPDAEY